MEAVRLLRYLGADELEISQMFGSSTGWAGSAVAKLPFSECQFLAASTSKTDRNMRVTGRFEYVASREDPKLPPNLVWYNDEPSWKEIAEGRLQGRLSTFSLNLDYARDYGVNAKLKAQCDAAGFESGGIFCDFEMSKWTLAGKFPKSGARGVPNRR
jgi:hypothetical protein